MMLRRHVLQVFLFVRACVRIVVPDALLGGVANRRRLLRVVRRLVTLGRFETLRVGEVMHGVKVREVMHGVKVREVTHGVKVRKVTHGVKVSTSSDLWCGRNSSKSFSEWPYPWSGPSDHSLHPALGLHRYLVHDVWSHAHS